MVAELFDRLNYEWTVNDCNAGLVTSSPARLRKSEELCTGGVSGDNTC
jgi:hypothetical protein